MRLPLPSSFCRSFHIWPLHDRAGHVLWGPIQARPALTSWLDIDIHATAIRVLLDAATIDCRKKAKRKQEELFVFFLWLFWLVPKISVEWRWVAWNICTCLEKKFFWIQQFLSPEWRSCSIVLERRWVCNCCAAMYCRYVLCYVTRWHFVFCWRCNQHVEQELDTLYEQCMHERVFSIFHSTMPSSSAPRCTCCSIRAPETITVGTRRALLSQNIKSSYNYDKKTCVPNSRRYDNNSLALSGYDKQVWKVILSRKTSDAWNFSMSPIALHPAVSLYLLRG